MVLEALADEALALDRRLAFHNHAGTFVETPQEVDRLLASCDPDLVGLCLDTGHYIVGGGNPAEALRRYGTRVTHVHLKDVAPGPLADLRDGRLVGFLDALQRYIFCGLGKGSVDLAGFVDGLRRAAFAGWMVIEEDTSPDPPLTAARRNRRYLQEMFGI